MQNKMSNKIYLNQEGITQYLIFNGARSVMNIVAVS